MRPVRLLVPLLSGTLAALLALGACTRQNAASASPLAEEPVAAAAGSDASAGSAPAPATRAATAG